MAEQPYILLDPRAGSSALKPYLQALGAHVDDTQQIPADFAFAGYGPEGLIPIGGEYKLTVSGVARLKGGALIASGDIFTSMGDGRLTGTQLPRMLGYYPRRYLLIEGATRVADDGVALEVCTRSGDWLRARGRGDAGWSAHEYWARLSSIAEFFSEPSTEGRTEVKEAFNKRESAAWIVSMWRYWQKPYDEHESYRAWDCSGDHGAQPTRVGMHRLSFTPTSELPIVQRMAAEIDGIGARYSGYVAKHFATPAEMILADEREWRQVEFMQKLKKKGAGYRRIHFSAETVKKIRKQLWGAALG